MGARINQAAPLQDDDESVCPALELSNPIFALHVQHASLSALSAADVPSLSETDGHGRV
jgi:hypothetical protein